MERINEKLFQAVTDDDFSKAEKALHEGANAGVIQESKNEHTKGETPALWVACKNKNEKMVQLLLNHGADPNEEYIERHPWGWEKEPCFHAAFPSVSLTRLMLENGANPQLNATWGEDGYNVVTTLQAAANQSGYDSELLELIKQYQHGFGKTDCGAD